jgi:hypothetical protein
MHYEDLLQDNNAVMDRVLGWIGEFPVQLRVEPLRTKCSYRNCTKNTSDDLRKVILNFEEVESYIKAEFPCLMSHLRETKPDQVMPSISNECSASLKAAVNEAKHAISLKHRK